MTFIRINANQYIKWDKVVLVTFQRGEYGKIVAAELEFEGGGATAKGEYAEDVWKKMFPTREPHDIL